MKQNKFFITHNNKLLKQADVDFTNVLIKNVFSIFINLDNVYFSAFDLEKKVTEIFKYSQHFSEKKHGQGRGKNYQIFRKTSVT